MGGGSHFDAGAGDRQRRLRCRAGPGLTAGADAPLSLIVEPEAGRKAVLDLVASARVSLWMEMYLLTDAGAIAAIAGRAAAGCDVRVILEPAPYQQDGANQPAYDQLLAAGVTSAGHCHASRTPTPRRSPSITAGWPSYVEPHRRGSGRKPRVRGHRRRRDRRRGGGAIFAADAVGAATGRRLAG